jgi:hypothetical protein
VNPVAVQAESTEPVAAYQSVESAQAHVVTRLSTLDRLLPVRIAAAMIAVLVALDSVFQVLAFGLLGWFNLTVLPGWLRLPGPVWRSRPGTSPATC